MDVMLDIETLGTKPGCVVLSVGAVAFDPMGVVAPDSPKFSSVISVVSSIECGLTIEPETALWWAGQSNDAKKQVYTGQEFLPSAANRFIDWYQKHSPEVGSIWAQGADFDMPVWGAAMAAALAVEPWPYWAKRDTRTLFDVAERLVGFDRKALAFEGTPHVALDDAVHQARNVQAAFRALRGNA